MVQTRSQGRGEDAPAAATQATPASEEIYPGHVLDWEAFASTTFPWTRDILNAFQTLGLQRLVSSYCELFQEQMVEFYSNAIITSSGEIWGETLGLQICVSPAAIAACFHLPEAVDVVPNYSMQAYGQFFDFKGNYNARHQFTKNGFEGKYRFLAHIIGKCVFGQHHGSDAVIKTHLELMYAVVNELQVDWASSIFKVWKKSLKTRPFGRMLSLLMLHQHVDLFEDVPGQQYPSKFILRSWTVEGAVAAEFRGRWTRSTASTPPGPSQRAQQPPRHSIHTEQPTEHAFPPAGYEEGLRQRLYQLKAIYMQHNMQLSFVYGFFRENSDQVIKDEDAIHWAYANNHIDFMQRDELLDLVTGRSRAGPSRKPSQAWEAPSASFPSPRRPAAFPRTAARDPAVTHLLNVTTKIQEDQKEIKGFMGKILVALGLKKKKKGRRQVNISSSSSPEVAAAPSQSPPVFEEEPAFEAPFERAFDPSYEPAFEQSHEPPAHEVHEEPATKISVPTVPLEKHYSRKKFHSKRRKEKAPEVAAQPPLEVVPVGFWPEQAPHDSDTLGESIGLRLNPIISMPASKIALHEFAFSSQTQARFAGEDQVFTSTQLQRIINNQYLFTEDVDNFCSTLRHAVLVDPHLFPNAAMYTIMLCEIYEQHLPLETLTARLRGYEGGHRPWNEAFYALLPMHVDKHFVLLHIDLRTFCVEVYDSAVDEDSNRRKKKILHGFLPRLSSALKAADFFHGKLTLVYLNSSELLQQPNHHSCGVFTCYFMIALLQNRAQWDRTGDTSDEFAQTLREMVAHMIFFYSHSNGR